MKLAIFSIATLLASPLLHAATGGKPFTNPLQSLQKATVHFDCHEVAPGPDSNGNTQFQFDLSLGATPGRVSVPNNVVLANVQQGTPVAGSPVFWATLPPQIFQTASGSVLAAGTATEHLSYYTKYDGAPLQNHYQPEWVYTLDIEQDQASMVVFAKYRAIHIVSPQSNCGTQTPDQCEPQQRAFDNETYLCEPR